MRSSTLSRKPYLGSLAADSGFPSDYVSHMKQQGVTVWLTGLPSSGKSTLARRLSQELAQRGCHVELLDGDEVRQWLTKDLGFTKADRDENVRRIGYVAKLLSRNGVVAVVAAISPYRELRDEVRREVGRFMEVYVKCSLDVCIARDVKGMYKRALAGEIQGFTGVSDPYEPPLSPQVVVNTDLESVEEGLSEVFPQLFLGLGQTVIGVLGNVGREIWMRDQNPPE